MYGSTVLHRRVSTCAESILLSRATCGSDPLVRAAEKCRIVSAQIRLQLMREPNQVLAHLTQRLRYYTSCPINENSPPQSSTFVMYSCGARLNVGRFCAKASPTVADDHTCDVRQSLRLFCQPLPISTPILTVIDGTASNRESIGPKQMLDHQLQRLLVPTRHLSFNVRQKLWRHFCKHIKHIKLRDRATH